MCIIEWIFLPTKNLPPFCVVVFSNLFSKKIDDTSRLLDEMKWNPRTVNSYPLSVTQLIIQVIQAACFFFVLWCHLTFSFDQVGRSPNSQHHCSWHYIDVGEGNWDFDELNEVLLWFDSKFTHFVVYWFWQSVKCTFRA